MKNNFCAILLSSFLAALCLTALSADRKDPKGIFGKMLVFKGESSGSAGFILLVNDKKYFVTTMDAAYDSRFTKVLDQESNEMKAGKLFTLDDGRDIAFFEADPKTTAEGMKSPSRIELEEFKDSKILAYGLSTVASSGPFVSVQTKIGGISSTNISLPIKVRKNESLSGGPLVSEKTGEVVGLLKLLPDNEYAAVRMDSIENLVEIDEKVYAMEAKRFYRIDDAFGACEQKLKELPKEIKDALEKIRKVKTLAAADKNAVKNSYAAIDREFGSAFQSLKELSGKSKIGFFNRKAAELLKQGEKLDEENNKIRKDVEEIDRRFSEAFEKQKVKEVNKIK